MTDQELSVIFDRHAFDPWLPGNRQRNCLYVMDRMAFDAAVREAIATSEAARLKAEAACAAILSAARCMIDKCDDPHCLPCDKCIQQILSTDAGQHVTDYIAAARRLREIIDIRLSVVKQNLLAPYLADVDAADAKLKGGGT